MELWNVAVCKRNDEADYYLLNRSRTPIKFTTKVPFSMGEFLAALENVGFPIRFTNGLELIRFRRIKNLFGLYGDNIVEIGAKPKRSSRVYIETFIHEVAHHVDSEEDISRDLDDERKSRGKHLHHDQASADNSEYFARGFERFYSPDPDDRKRLRKNNPKLYRTILRLHRKYSQR